MRSALALAAVAALCACQTVTRSSLSAARSPLQDEGAIYVYLQPIPPELDRVRATLGSVSAVAANGALLPLELAHAELSARDARGQRLLASGRLPPGAYAGFAVEVRRATLAAEGGTSDLLLPEQPTRVDAPFTVQAGGAGVTWLRLHQGGAVEKRFAWTPAFLAGPPQPPTAQVVGYASSRGEHAVFVLDKRNKAVTGVIPTARDPWGLALDGRRGRAYVAAAGADEVQVLESATGQTVGRVHLEPRDGPRALALTFDARTLLVLNHGSFTLSFVDPESLVETARIRTGDEPVALRLDRAGKRAYVLNARPAGIAAVDVANRSQAAAVATEADPLWADLNRAGNRLYVVHGGSPFLTLYSVPDLAPAGRVFVGLGASTVLVDPRTDLVYVGRADESRIDVYDPLSLVAIDAIDVPGPATSIALDATENALFALVPSRRAVAVIDLTSKRLLTVLDVGPDAHDVATAGETN